MHLLTGFLMLSGYFCLRYNCPVIGGVLLCLQWPQQLGRAAVPGALMLANEPVLARADPRL